jgi:fibronectin type 3 domain-containing protein
MKRIGPIFIILSVVFSCVNQNDTLVREVPQPLIDTVSQGLSSSCIRIDWRTDTIDIARFEIYRSLDETGPYLLLCVVEAAPTGNSYYDSVKTTDLYYYKLAAIDRKGRSSKLSASKNGFMSSLLIPPVLLLESQVDHIALFWSPVRGSGAYAIYRSSVSCTAGMSRIARSTSVEFRDSALPSSIAFYAVGALDSAGRDVVKSNCVWGGLPELATPENCRIWSEITPHTIFLQWNSVPGAREYVIYRSSAYCPKADEEFVRTKSVFYRDSIDKPGYYYYAVASVNNANRESVMSQCLRGSIEVLLPPDSIKASYGEYPNMIVVSWNAIIGARRYVIYRSTISCSSGMITIDSMTTSLVFKDSVPTSDACSYCVAGVDSLGIQGLSSTCIQGRVKLLPAPANLKATIGLYAGRVRVSWDSVPGADGYIYYRGKSNVSSLAIPIDTVTSLFDFDYPQNTLLQYYWVAARDRLGSGMRSGYVWGRILLTPELSLDRYDDSSLTLAWETDAAVMQWKYIYRYSLDEETFFFVDSAKDNFCRLFPEDYRSSNYCIVVKTAVGDSLVSNTVSGSRRIPAPTGLIANRTEDGVFLQWNSIPGIFEYDIFRSDSVSDSTYFYDDVYDTAFSDFATIAPHYYQVAADNGLLISSRSALVIDSVRPFVNAQKRAPIR